MSSCYGIRLPYHHFAVWMKQKGRFPSIENLEEKTKTAIQNDRLLTNERKIIKLEHPLRYIEDFFPISFSQMLSKPRNMFYDEETPHNLVAEEPVLLKIFGQSKIIFIGSIMSQGYEIPVEVKQRTKELLIQLNLGSKYTEFEGFYVNRALL